MAKFSNNYLSYFPKPSKLPKSSYDLVFIPIWLTKIIAPKFDRQQPNLFQETILKLINVRQSDRQQIAEWLGVDIELVSIIIDTELQPNGWVYFDGVRLSLTPKGKAILANEIGEKTQQEVYYVIQDAVTLEFWPRLIRKPEYVDVLEENDKIYIVKDRDSGKKIKTFILYESSDLSPQPLDHRKVLNIVDLHRSAYFSHEIRNEGDYHLKNIAIDDVELINAKSEPFYILTCIENTAKNAKHKIQLIDPTKVSQYGEWIDTLHLQLAEKNKAFADKLKSKLGSTVKDDNETVKDYEERIRTEAEFIVLMDYPNAIRIPQLPYYLDQVIAQKTVVRERRNYEDLRSLISQTQIVLEACFKYMLSQWPVEHSKIIPKQANKKDIEQIVLQRTMNKFSDDVIQKLCTVNPNQVIRATRYGLGEVSELGISLKPMIVANLLSVSDYSNHPLTVFEDYEEDMNTFFEICEARNEGAHYSETPVEIDVDDMLTLTAFTLQWIKNFTNKLD